MAKRPKPSPEGGPRAGGRPSHGARPRVIFEDEDILVADKPVGLPTAVPPGSGAPRRTLFEFVKAHVRRNSVGRARVWVVHRLDSEVSGLIAFAKTERAFNWLKDDLRARRMQRIYLALVEGDLAGTARSSSSGPASEGEASGTIQSLLRELPNGQVRVIPPGEIPRHGREARERPVQDDEARHAVTHYRVVASANGLTLARVRLETGRKHQIRAHMAWMGHPVAGDRRYGAQTDPIRRVALHAAELTFSHPVTGQTMRLQSAAPAAFWKLVGREPPSVDPSPSPVARPTGREARAPTAWDEVADWYDDLVEDRRNDLHHEVVLPGAMRLLEPEAGQRVLDLACGQGVLCRELARLGVKVWGVDASARLIDLARQRSPRDARFEVLDATRLQDAPAGLWPREGFDAVCCVMALMNMEPLSGAVAGAAGLLRPGGRFVAVVLHPVFRSPGRTAWGWEQAEGSVRQYRRVDSYLSPGRREIVMNPGKAARGSRPVVTWTYHRPVQTYVQHLTACGLLLDRLEEWPSPRRSEPGPRAEEENRARREIPMFLGLRGVKVGG